MPRVLVGLVLLSLLTVGSIVALPLKDTRCGRSTRRTRPMGVGKRAGG
jgi:hypothetical protein